MTQAVVREPDLYGPHSRNSWFQDAARADIGDGDAARRMAEHAAHEAPERQRRAAEREVSFRDHAEAEGLEVRTNPNTTLGSGGEFAPPLWLMDKFASGARAGRPLGDLLNPLPLPAGVQSINTPRMTTGSLAGPQEQNGQPLTSQDLVTTAITAPVVTIGGELVVSQQLEDQAPAGFDAYAYVDLCRAYNRALEGQLLFGTGVGNTHLGIANVPGIATVAATNSTMGSAAPNFWTFLGQAAAAVGNARSYPPEIWLMAPRRWFWIASSVDGSFRPISSPGNSGPFAALEAPIAGGALAVGPVLGLPVFQDAAIPAGTNSDTVFACRPSDMFLWEGDDRLRISTNATAGTLQVRIQLFRYSAFMSSRYPSGIAQVTTTTPPSGF